ncbi:MAG TPA: inorganic phosphate transporter [Epsilonproteobacteria bacterium]|nr:inorganic phosphate transporter [Campylobacterota bacterium]
MHSGLKLVLGVLFALGVVLYVDYALGEVANKGFLILAAVFGAYMAMNIGANDVANNVGPAVGSGALTLASAIAIAAIFEFLGAVIAGGQVVGTIKKGIISLDAFDGNPMVFVEAMSAALLAAAIWLNLATWLKAPVSTTHAIVGGVMGAGIAAGGFGIVSWGTMGAIAASWVISPVLGGVIAAILLYIIKSKILYKNDKIGAAKQVVPWLVAFMIGVFVSYLFLKGFAQVWKNITQVVSFLPQTNKPPFGVAALFGLGAGTLTYFFVKPRIEKKVALLGDLRDDLNTLFTIPLIFSGALLSFAHGANDVANAIGPLAAVNDALVHMTISSKASIPMWVMIVGGLGIAIGLALYGPRLIKTVGSEITDLDQMRAFSIMMAAAITVLIASQLGLPVSSTHIAVGAIFGVGFLREWLEKKNTTIHREKLNNELQRLEEYKQRLKSCPLDAYKDRFDLTQAIKSQKKKVKKVKKVLRDNYIKRGMIKKIVTAWIVTVPSAAILSALVFFVIRGAAL